MRHSQWHRQRWLAPLWSCGIWILACSLPIHSSGQALSDTNLADIRFEQKLGAALSPNLPFRDENGKAVTLGAYLGQKPVVLVLGYYECPMLCTLVLNGLVAGMSELKASVGTDYEVVDVSINPLETPALAAAKKQSYLKQYGRPGAASGWHFLTGDQRSIKRLADEVGFRYAYDAPSKQYAHPSGLVILTPQGKVAHYLFGVTYAPRELSDALHDAAGERVGSPIAQVLLLCFHYNPLTGKYSSSVIAGLRVLAVATMGGIFWLLLSLVRRGGAQPRPACSAGPLAGDRSPGDDPAGARVRSRTP